MGCWNRDCLHCTDEKTRFTKVKTILYHVSLLVSGMYDSNTNTFPTYPKPAPHICHQESTERSLYHHTQYMILMMTKQLDNDGISEANHNQTSKSESLRNISFLPGHSISRKLILCQPIMVTLIWKIATMNMRNINQHFKPKAKQSNSRWIRSPRVTPFFPMKAVFCSFVNTASKRPSQVKVPSGSTQGACQGF